MDRTPIESNAKFMQKSRGHFLMGHSLLKNVRFEFEEYSLKVWLERIR